MMLGKCEACGLLGLAHLEDSVECQDVQRDRGCHACDKWGCWTTKESCKFFNKVREAHRDAGFGDLVPHEKQVDIKIIDEGTQVPLHVQLPVGWWHRRRVVVRIDGLDFSIGRASGHQNNCLIDSLRQCLDMICHVENLRSKLVRLHKNRVTRIPEGDFLDFADHWQDVITLLSEFDQSSKPVVRCSTVTIVCVDLNLPGHGNVVGTGPHKLYIARQNLNHFVPLVRTFGRGGQGSSSSSSGYNPAAFGAPPKPVPGASSASRASVDESAAPETGDPKPDTGSADTENAGGVPAGGHLPKPFSGTPGASGEMGDSRPDNGSGQAGCDSGVSDSGDASDGADSSDLDAVFRLHLRSG
jgi:hypothetical protein